MHLDEILKAIVDDLETWCQTRKANLSTAHDPWMPYEILGGTGPQQLQVVAQLGGSTPEGDQPDANIESLGFDIFVGYNLGLEVKPGRGLFETRGTRAPLLRIVSECRAHVLSLQFPENDETGQYLAAAGIESATIPGDGTPLLAYKFRVSLSAVVEIDDYRPMSN